MHRPFLSSALRVLLAGVVPTLHAQPSWWSDSATGILEPGSPPHDYSPANLGQLKHVATQANLYLDTALAPGGESGSAVDVACQFTDTSNFSPLNLGQLKNVPRPSMTAWRKFTLTGKPAHLGSLLLSTRGR